MWGAYSTTKDIFDPTSRATAKPMLDGGAKDPRAVGGLDYWIIGLLDYLRCKQGLPVFHQLEWKDVANVDFTAGLLAGVK